jgi:hypothetical protein
MSIIRKPHNLVTAYWDDSEFFLNAAEVAESQKGTGEYDILFPDDKRGMRFTILSSFLFLEAFINAEYFNEEVGHVTPESVSPAQRNMLDQMMIKTSFDDKWSKWIGSFCKNGKQDLKGRKEFQELKKLKELRNHLTHYKIHNLMLVAHEIETIVNAREANRIAKQTVEWYYQITEKKIPAWISRDILKKAVSEIQE